MSEWRIGRHNGQRPETRPLVVVYQDSEGYEEYVVGDSTADALRKRLNAFEERLAVAVDLAEALEATLGLLNEMHPHVGCGSDPCTQRTDFCGAREYLRKALSRWREVTA